MALQDIQTLKNDLSTDKELTGEKFANLIDSFFHKGSTIPIEKIFSLKQSLSSKIDKSEVANFVSGLVNMGSVKTIAELNAIPNPQDGWGYIVEDAKDANGNSYIYRYTVAKNDQGAIVSREWVNTKLVAFGSDVVTKKQLTDTVVNYKKSNALFEYETPNSYNKYPSDIVSNIVLVAENVTGQNSLLAVNKISVIAVGTYLGAPTARIEIDGKGYNLASYIEDQKCIYGVAGTGIIVKIFLSQAIPADWDTYKFSDSANEVSASLLRDVKAKYVKQNPYFEYSYANRVGNTASDVIESISVDPLNENIKKYILQNVIITRVGVYGGAETLMFTGNIVDINSRQIVLTSDYAASKPDKVNMIFKIDIPNAGITLKFKLKQIPKNSDDFTWSATSNLNKLNNTLLENVQSFAHRSELDTAKIDLRVFGEKLNRVHVETSDHLNLVKISDLLVDKKYINPSSGKVTTTSAPYCNLESFQPVDSAWLYYNNIRSIAFYSGTDESSFISGIDVPSGRKAVPSGAKYMRYSLYDQQTNVLQASIVAGENPVNFEIISLPNVVEKGNNSDVSYSKLIQLCVPEATPKGRVMSSDTVSQEQLFFNDGFLAGEAGEILGTENVEKGEVLMYKGDGVFDRVKKNYINHVDEVKTYDVVIVGAGTGGVAAAYALKNKGYNIAIVDKLASLGGNATNGRVDTWIQGLTPPYLVGVFDYLKARSKASGDIEESILPPKFSKYPTEIVWIEPEALSEKYREDLDGQVSIMLSTEFVSISERINDKIKGVYVRDLHSGKVTELRAKFFIESSADGVLCRSSNSIVDVDYYYGRDLQSTYNESVAPVSSIYKLQLNEPTLMFELREGVDNSDKFASIDTVYAEYDSSNKITKVIKPSYISADGYCNNIWCNSMTGCCADEGGRVILQKGVENYTKEFIETRVWEYWKYIKLVAQWKKEQGIEDFAGWTVTQVEKLGVTGVFAKFMGMRETYRINCDYMINQNDLTKLIRSSDIKDYIAVGSHEVDFHIREGLNMDELDKLRGAGVYESTGGLQRPCGVPYRSLIPKKLSNVLIGSRCYGASQIALASIRTNKDMAQLGWAAGKAMLIALENGLDDVRKVDIPKLQSDQYTRFKTNLQKMEENIKEGL